jgi:thiamine-phosphate pyrophosphorylase
VFRTLCLITDRRRLVTAMRAPARDWPDLVVDQVRGAIAGGVDLVQIRERGVDDSLLVDVTRRCVEAAAGSQARILVNDRPDVAVAAGAHGVHLRRDGLPPSIVRRLVPDLIIGRSIDDAGGAQGSIGADYLIAGSVFETLSKPGQRGWLGADGLASIVGVTDIPVLAVGGIDAGTLTLIAGTGAAGAAAIGAFVPAQQVPDLVTAVQRLTKSLRIAFDSRDGGP